MAWLRGQATQATIIDKLTKLACGEVADDTAVTTSVGDRWRRGVGGQDFIVPPASKKVALPSMSMRAGYYQPSHRLQAASPNMSGNWVRQTNIFTSAPSGATRWIVGVHINVVNSVANNYSTATVIVCIWDADTGVGIYQAFLGVNAAGDVSGLPNGMAIRVGNSENGILRVSTNNIGFMRQFDTTYVGGVDFWPMEHRRDPGEASVFTVNPPGTEGTDWVRDVRVVTYRNGATTGFSNSWTNGIHIRGGCAQGLGIKTNAGLTGGLYTVSWSVVPMSLRMLYNGTQYIQAEVGCGFGIAPGDGLGHRIHGTTLTAWMRMFTGAPLSSSVVQYWMCVKADRIIIVLNGDPGVGGVLSVNGLWEFTPNYPAVDKFSWAIGRNQQQYLSDNNSMEDAFNPGRQHGLWVQRVIASGYDMPASRDWGTGWMRTDATLYSYDDLSTRPGGDPGYGDNDMGYPAEDANVALAWGTSPSQYMGTPGVNGFDVNSNQGAANEDQRLFPSNEPKPSWGDTKWWLYGIPYTDSSSGTFGTSPSQSPVFKFRGRTLDKVLFCPETGWSSGDELTDTDTSKVYFLVRPDYAGAGFGRIRVGSNLYYGGIAIEETA